MNASVKEIDYKLFFPILALIIFGMIMISSVSVYSSFRVTNLLVKAQEIQEPYNYFYVIRNIFHVLLSGILCIFLVKTHYKIIERYTPHIFLFTLGLLVTVIFSGIELNGTTGWLYIPGLPFLIQPMEFTKLSVILFLAYFFTKNEKNNHTFMQGFVPFLALVSIIALLLGLQPDFGGILIISSIMFILFFVAGGNIKYLAVLGIIASVFAISIYNAGKYDKSNPSTKNRFSYITDRIDNFFLNEKEQIANKTINYQTLQALIAIGSGGFGGLGFGNSIQKFGYLPEVQGDFIFSVIVEELGFLGGITIILIYGYIGYRGYYIAYYTKDTYGKLVAFGITSRILIQSFINIAVNVNVFPLTGITLPFISYGGSSLISLMIGVSILLNISRYIEVTQNKRKVGWEKQKTFSIKQIPQNY